MNYIIECKDWNPEKVAEVLSRIQNVSNLQIVLQLEEENREKNAGWEKKVGEYLNNLGVPRHLIGYGYLKYCVARCICCPQELESVTKLLYPETAKKYNTTSGKVEHGIRHAIKKAWENARTEEWDIVFGTGHWSVKQKPTNSQFIAALSDYIAMDN